MADDLADFPIVVLENDAPEEVGKLGLFDLLMPVGNTGLIFKAAVPGVLQRWGVKFSSEVGRAANLRAATTLIHMGLIRGESLVFIREALWLSPQELADSLGVVLSSVAAWESNAAVVPLHAWENLALLACFADGRTLPNHHALCPDWRPRVIRVFPNIPARGLAQASIPSAYSSPVPFGGFPGAECFPPPHC